MLATALNDHPFQRFITQLLQNQNTLHCIELETEFNINSNLVLYAIWFAKAQHGRLQKPYIKTLFTAVYNWHDYILVSLKRLLELLQHTRLKPSAAIKRMLEIEIQQAEYAEQQLLADVIVPLKFLRRNDIQKLSDACYNILNYIKCLQIPLKPTQANHFVTLLEQCFPHLSHHDITHTFKLMLDNEKLIPNNPAQLRLNV